MLIYLSTSSFKLKAYDLNIPKYESKIRQSVRYHLSHIHTLFMVI